MTSWHPSPLFRRAPSTPTGPTWRRSSTGPSGVAPPRPAAVDRATLRRYLASPHDPPLRPQIHRPQGIVTPALLRAGAHAAVWCSSTPQQGSRWEAAEAGCPECCGPTSWRHSSTSRRPASTATIRCVRPATTRCWSCSTAAVCGWASSAGSLRPTSTSTGPRLGAGQGLQASPCVPLSQPAVDALRRWIDSGRARMVTRRVAADAIFVNQRGNPPHPA